MIDNSIIKMLAPMVEKNLSEEKISNVFNKILDQYPLEPTELKNSIIITLEKDGKTYLSVVGLCYNSALEQFYINKVKNHMTANKAIKLILSQI